jgi:hypothetical protein
MEVEIMAKDQNNNTQASSKVLTIVPGAVTSGVLGVKGDKEEEYRDGYVNITPEDIGISPQELKMENVNGTLKIRLE